MLTWISQNIGTIIVCLILFFTVALVIIKMRKDKKKGKSSCGCNCGCCPMADKCHSQK